MSFGQRTANWAAEDAEAAASRTASAAAAASHQVGAKSHAQEQIGSGRGEPGSAHPSATRRLPVGDDGQTVAAGFSEGGPGPVVGRADLGVVLDRVPYPSAGARGRGPLGSRLTDLVGAWFGHGRRF